MPADLVEKHILSLIFEDLKKYRDDERLHEYVEDELAAILRGRSDTWTRLATRLEELDAKLAKLKEHLVAMDAATAKSLGLYDEATALSSERTVLVEMDKVRGERIIVPSIEDVRARVRTEFDRLGEVFDSGTVDEKREIIRAYVYRVEAAPERQTLVISLFPGVVSQMVAGAGFEPATFGL